IFWLSIYSLFWFDATATLLKRIITGKKWYIGHNDHAYQILYKAGWSHQKVLRGATFINALIFTNTLCMYHFPQYTITCISACLILLFALYITIHIKYDVYREAIKVDR
ncbi:MAG: hypothetical protein KC414_12170, partial [Romboutsia sp.]|nr:hypothetical protein [Romboutsia sp.]